jgi:hypothetical protein
VVAAVLKARGDVPGLVHVISAMKTCATCQSWRDKPSGRTFLRPDPASACTTTSTGSTANSADLRLRVPTYCPFGLHGLLQRPSLAGATADAPGHRPRDRRVTKPV